MSELKMDVKSHQPSLLLLFALTSTVMASGLVYGWPALRKNILEEGSELDEKQLGVVFTVGAWSSQGGRFFAGLARDRIGTRMTACICSFCATVGVACLAFGNANDVFLLAVSLFLLGLGSGVLLCVQPVASLFPKNSHNVIFLLTGAFLFPVSCFWL